MSQSPIQYLAFGCLTEPYRYTGAAPLLELCALAQRYYEEHFYTTEVLAASLTSVEDVMALVGARHMTIAPPLLRELSSTEASGYDSKTLNVFEVLKARHDQPPALISFADDEAAFRTAFKQNDNGNNQTKMTQVSGPRALVLIPKRQYV